MIGAIAERASTHETAQEQKPVNLDATLSPATRGVCRLDDRLLVITEMGRKLAGASAEGRPQPRWRRA